MCDAVSHADPSHNNLPTRSIAVYFCYAEMFCSRTMHEKRPMHTLLCLLPANRQPGAPGCDPHVNRLQKSLADTLPKRKISPASHRINTTVPLVAALLLLLPCAHAETPDFLLVVQQELDPALATAVRANGDGDKGTIRIADIDAVCAEQPADTPRFALFAGRPQQADLDACHRTAASDVLAVTIGYQAVALVTPARSAAFPLHSTDLFRAVTAHADPQRVPAVWRDVTPKLPALPIGLFAPPEGSTADRLLDTYVMDPACGEQDGTRPPNDSIVQVDFCHALRAAPVVLRRKGNDHEVADWAASAAAGQLAVVSLAELRKLDHVVMPLPLDDVMPTAANIASGHYPAAEPVTLLVVVPSNIPAERRGAARGAIFELLSERCIGPDGNLAQAGLVPLPPADRVATRMRTVAFVQHP